MIKTNKNQIIMKKMKNVVVLDKKALLEIANGEKKIDVWTVRYEGNDGFVSIGELTLYPPTHYAEDRSANASRQEVTAFGQLIPECLPLHVTASFCSL